jgi:hypothetical protein
MITGMKATMLSRITVRPLSPVRKPCGFSEVQMKEACAEAVLGPEFLGQ